MLYESRPRSKDFDRALFKRSEDGYLVEFSNQGQKVHNNPNPIKLTDAPIPCILPGCGLSSRRLDGLCKNHAPKKGEDRAKVISRHWADWIGRIIPPGMTRPQCLTWAPPHTRLLELLISWEEERKGERAAVLDKFILDVMGALKGAVPDSTKLEADLEAGGHLAGDVVSLARGTVDKAFPIFKFRGSVIPRPGTYRGVKLDGITVRTVAGLLVLGVASEEANRGDLWTYKTIKRPGSSKRASVFMPMAYYYLRVHLGATKAQASQSVRH